MDALRKQAGKFREQVAKQQQAVIKQLSSSGYESSDVMVIDEIEMQRHQQLEKLYRATRAAREYQKDIVKAAEGFTAIGYKHTEIDKYLMTHYQIFLVKRIFFPYLMMNCKFWGNENDCFQNCSGTKLSEDSCNYGAENISDNILAKAAAVYGDARKHVEKEQEDYNKLLYTQILEPVRPMISGAPLEDARHLAQRYSRMRQEAEVQAVEVSRRQARVRETPIPENVARLHVAEEAKMKEMKANMAVLGKEAASALAAVEGQQQRLTFQRLVSMVEGEKTFYLRVAAILGEIEAEIVSEKQRKESAPPVSTEIHTKKTSYFLAEAVHPFYAETEKELSLSVGDYVVVRQVNQSRWSEGECKGKAGWFPSGYVEKRQRIPTSNGSGYGY